jgi:Transposase DDE domain group 1
VVVAGAVWSRLIEQVHADLKNSALAHLPSGVFTANAAWLVLAVMAFNLTRVAATITGPALANATTATIRRKLIVVPARAASSARRLALHLPAAWPWEMAWTLTVHPGLWTPCLSDDLTSQPIGASRTIRGTP